MTILCNFSQNMKRVITFGFLNMADHGWNILPNQEDDDNAQTSHHKKRSMPADQVSQIKGKWNAQCRCNRKGTHHSAHSSTSALVRKKIRDNGQYLGTDNAAKQSGNNTRHQQQ